MMMPIGLLTRNRNHGRSDGVRNAGAGLSWPGSCLGEVCSNIADLFGKPADVELRG
jgi:hypothetical protein